jgi:hypothetical protein
MKGDKITFRAHAIQRMFERKVSEDDVCEVIKTGEVIEDYPDDTPYPSALMLGQRESRPIHVVVAYNESDDETIVITAYEPDTEQWDDEFKKRRKP